MTRGALRELRDFLRATYERHVVRMHCLRAQTDHSPARNSKRWSVPPQRSTHKAVEHDELLTCASSARQPRSGNIPSELRKPQSDKEVRKEGVASHFCHVIQTVPAPFRSRQQEPALIFGLGMNKQREPDWCSRRLRSSVIHWSSAIRLVWLKSSRASSIRQSRQKSLNRVGDSSV
jgi:hypothetical protein